MKTHEIVGFKRANLGKTEATELRSQGYVPSVLYGGAEQVHFYAPAMLFRELLFTPDIFNVTLNIEGTLYNAILQERQFHPVNDSLIHADFLQIVDGKEVKVDVPVKLTGTSTGVMKGGKMNQKLRKLRLQGLAENIPDYVNVDVTELDLGKSVKVGAVKAENFVILTAASNPIASVEIPRALRGTLGK
ncbi:50S ribosomal protein L25/general stress protein Ctc [Dyadobacter sp. CY326]|uniref:50S ribosomal protein L25/general stress protein Ctc n=1 Tax=Dyadobacter sp. CY326 TaxID=2907300 RepID=UPI001F2773E6|nr:50S ribosomal protein L25/general stress protein Ctc [Dyadobacter sp. CY326]MCE7068478.1 50S ribosomal protein L25/general stress protein Ctc [Dyadobacter sp. CY326]